MDDELKNRLWSVLQLEIFDKWRYTSYLDYKHQDTQLVEFLVSRYWLDYFKWPTDTIPPFKDVNRKSAYNILREHFFKADWWQVYDFIEFTIKNVPNGWEKSLIVKINRYLELENAAYRVVDKEVVEITDEIEIDEIESALDTGSRSIREHLRRSLELLSDRQSPDYRNATKESISAVEAACRLISGDEKATLASALKKIGPIHPALKDAMSKLYGYTSDEGGIRHSLTEDAEKPTFAEAKFMLVAASAFINFLWAKSAEKGLQLPKT